MSDTSVFIKPYIVGGNIARIVVPTTATTTWNPSDKGADLILSNGNLDANATIGGNPTFNSARSTTSKTTGKWYIEFETIASGSSFLSVGICYLTSSMSDAFYNTGDSAGTLETGVFHNIRIGVFTNPDSQDNSGGTTGSTLQLAIDMTAGKGWFGILNVWGNGGGDPSTGANPHFIWTPTATAIYAVMSAHGTFGGKTRIKPTGISQLHSPPSGFTAWG